MFAIQCTDNVTGRVSIVKCSTGDDDLVDQTYDTREEAEVSLPGWCDIAAALEWNCTYTVVPYNEESANA